MFWLLKLQPAWQSDAVCFRCVAGFGPCEPAGTRCRDCTGGSSRRRAGGGDRDEICYGRPPQPRTWPRPRCRPPGRHRAWRVWPVPLLARRQARLAGTKASAATRPCTVHRARRPTASGAVASREGHCRWLVRAAPSEQVRSPCTYCRPYPAATMTMTSFAPNRWHPTSAAHANSKRMEDKWRILGDIDGVR